MWFLSRLSKAGCADTDTDTDTIHAGVVRCGAVQGSCTLLFQKDVGGLQVEVEAGTWVDVPPRPACLVVYVGDAME